GVASLRALTYAWLEGGGHVIGLAPSAAAAAQLRDATGAPAETLAKLTWSIHHLDLPDWPDRTDRSSLVIIDEAGMADTLFWIPPSSSSPAGVAVFGWSVMINNSPQSGPARGPRNSKQTR